MDAIKKTDKYYMPVFNRYPIVLERGQGVYAYDTNGKEYLDCLAGIAVNALGYAHPVMVKALTEQAGKLIHTANLFYSQVQADLCEKICSLSGFDKVFLANSGAEANEGAIKLARKYGNETKPGKNKVITAKNSFHGRTMLTLVATGQPKYQQGFTPLPTGFEYVEYGKIEQLQAAIDDDVCAVMLEVVQGEGGVQVVSQDYLQQVRQLCDKHGALLIFDEIQTGVCRMGEWFGYQTVGVKPDILTLAKALGCGYPIGAFLAQDKIANYFKPGDHGSTFGGNHLGCAVALAVLNYMEKENMPQQVAEKGNYLLKKLQELKQKHGDKIVAVRGKGLIVGIELNTEGKDLVSKCLEKGVIVNCTAGNVIRLVPPLIISFAELDKLCSVLDECM